MFKKTKIVVTVGPACNTEKKLEQLIKAGATMFRINTSHGNPEVHKEVILRIKKVAEKLKTYTPILVDLQGPKIRVGNIPEPIELKKDQEVIIAASENVKEGDNIIPVDYAGIANDVKVGARMLMDDGKIVLETTFVDPINKYLKAKVIHPNILKPRKGLNIPGATTSIKAVTDRDIEFIKFAVDNDIDYLALSFVRNKDDILTAKKYLDVFGNNIPIIAKIEKPQAVENIDEIIDVSDGIMVARGDLGIELSPEKVPIVQKQIIEKCNEQRKVVIVATQMLESMIEEPIPTRAEASDVANAILDGADAIMLSAETSVGQFPVESVKMMTKIAENVEESNFCLYNRNLTVHDSYEFNSQAIVSATVKISKDIKVDAIVAFTHTGYTTKLLAKERPSVPILALSDSIKTCRRLNLYWNVEPFEFYHDGIISREVIKELDEILIEKVGMKFGHKVIITGAVPKLITGRTNFILVHVIGEIIK